MDSKQIFIAFLGLLLIGFGVFVALRNSQTEKEDPTPQNGEKVEEITAIEGSLGYPSERIPSNVDICAKEVGSDQEYCTDQYREKEKYKYGVGYKLELPAGNYYLFASRPENQNYRGAYTNCVDRKKGDRCENRKPLKVAVKEGEVNSGIDLLDWAQFPEKLNYETEKEEIELERPTPFKILSSRFEVSGEASGAWFFEGQFPIRVVGPDGTEHAAAAVQTPEDWMTGEDVRFETGLDLKRSVEGLNYLVLEKANPSGKEENADKLRIPVYID